MSARGLGVPGLLEDGMMDGWLDYREYNLNANAISTTYNLSNYLLKYSKRDNGGFNAGPKPPKLAAIPSWPILPIGLDLYQISL